MSGGMDELRERIARALWERELTRCGVTGKRRETARTVIPTEFYEDADAAIAALGLREMVSYDTPTGGIPPFEFVGDESDLDEALEAYAKAYQIPKVRRWVTPPERVET